VRAAACDAAITPSQVLFSSYNDGALSRKNVRVYFRSVSFSRPALQTKRPFFSCGSRFDVDDRSLADETLSVQSNISQYCIAKRLAWGVSKMIYFCRMGASQSVQSNYCRAALLRATVGKITNERRSERGLPDRRGNARPKAFRSQPQSSLTCRVL